MRPDRIFAPSLILLALVLLPAVATAYPEYQASIQTSSGRSVNCGLCHAHPDGPEGTKQGQIGRLDAAGLEELNTARRALEPGQKVHNPVLNSLGSSLVEQIGRKRLLTLRRDPQLLTESMSQTSDLDADGITDARELHDGTDALDPNHGDPWLLFRANLARNWFHIVMTALATGLGLFGLNHLLHGLHLISGGARREHDEFAEQKLSNH